MTKEKSTESAAPAQTGFKKKNLIIIALVFAGFWALAISSQSLIFMGIAGFFTLLAAGIAFWAWRTISRHKKLANVLQGAGDSPEARKKALATLAAGKNPNSITNIIARAQLLASDEPSEALALLDPIEIKTVPANAQDDFAILKSQLLLNFGRAKLARPLVDYVNLDNPSRKEMRPFMVAIVAETWARTGSAAEANEILNSVPPEEVSGNDAGTLLLIARVYAQFGAGKKGLTRSALSEVAAVDPNLLGRFLASKGQVHPGLQRLARETFERTGSRKQGRAHIAAGGRGRR